MNKRFCVLQVTPREPNPEHVKLFHNKEHSDFYFVTYEKENDNALKFCPNTVWSETRNTLAELVPKKYDYYFFMDHDIGLESQTELDAYEQTLEDLKLNPAVLTFYPGRGIDNPIAQDIDFLKSKKYSYIPFTHNGIKIVHKSLLQWFFPMFVKYRTDTDACHMFNIQEIPFLKNVVCSHTIVHHNNPTDSKDTQTYNSESGYTKHQMDEMWKSILPAFKKRGVLSIGEHINPDTNYDSLAVKYLFVDLFKRQNFEVTKNPKDIDFFDLNRIETFFDLNDERFLNIHLPLSEKSKPFSPSATKIINETLHDLQFEDFVTPIDPWPAIANKINNKIKGRKITYNECVERYQTLENNKSLFHLNSTTSSELEDYLRDKTVALVGPSPYLANYKRGEEIDSCDVVVRIQHNIYNTESYGSRSDIIQSCLNPNYGNPLVQHIANSPPEERPKFVICNDTASAQKRDELPVGGLNWQAGWYFNDELFGPVFKQLKIPFVNLKRKDGKWDRWALYWQVYAKKHIERFSKGSYTIHTANFNSGYGAINFLLSYPVKELKVFGLDFYNLGKPQVNEQKYNQSYISTYGDEGRNYGPDKMLHDQLSQLMHLKNVLLKDERLVFDEHVSKLLNDKDLDSRIERFKSLPKLKRDTR